MSASIHHSVDSIGSSINKDTSSAYSDQYISKLSSYSQKQFEYGLECVDEPDKNQDFSSVTKSVKWAFLISCVTKKVQYTFLHGAA